MVDIGDPGEPVGKRGESVSVADEHVSSLHLKRVIGEVSSAFACSILTGSAGISAPWYVTKNS
jgi:hypothetical protein